MKSTGKWYQVLLKDQQIVQASIRGKLRLEGLKTTNPIAAGDRVEIVPGSDGAWSITEILERSNYIVRKATNLSKQMQILAANVDRAYLLVTLKSPITQIAFIDRFLVAAESFRIPTTLLFNKIDLFDEADTEYFEALKVIYENLGYPCVGISAEKPAKADLRS